MSDYSFSYEPYDESHKSEHKYKFRFWINHNLVYSFEDCDPMTEQEAHNLAEELWVEWQENK
jgi:hypothetical protein